MKKLGELAKENNILPSQIRYYVKEGLLSPAEKTKGGFLLFSEKEAAVLARIFELKKERRTIKEIRETLATEDAVSK